MVVIAEDAVLNQCFEISNDVDIFKKKIVWGLIFKARKNGRFVVRNRMHNIMLELKML